MVFLQPPKEKSCKRTPASHSVPEKPKQIFPNDRLMKNVKTGQQTKFRSSKKLLTIGFGDTLYLIFLLDGIAAGKINK